VRDGMFHTLFRGGTWGEMGRASARKFAVAAIQLLRQQAATTRGDRSVDAGGVETTAVAQLPPETSTPAPDVSARVAQLKNDAQTAAEELSTLSEEQRRHVLRIATEALRPTHEFIQLLAPVGQPESATADRGTAISDLLIPALQVLRNEARMALAQPQTDPTVVPENVADKAREYHQLAKDWARQHGLTEVTAPETDVVKLRSSLTAHVAFLKKRAEVATSVLDVVARPGQSAWARDMAREALLYQRSFVQQVEDVMSPGRTEARRTWAMDEIIKPGLELVAATLFQTRQGGAEWLGHPDALPAPVADVVQQVDALVRA